ncbi:hypothetical protein GH714_013374 [Hevea brasiliensis]|uniref:Transposase MuDR plant domain-containing protein n=1 Tax=Hevea brasiliensis TaxID=3981 RepID=A0A6A6M4V3_HEVBR|nr:hypothetical protein GH714_013374 [Hevea brasiliensis]
MYLMVHDEISFSLCIHNSGTLGEWGYYDGKTWTVHGLTWDTMSIVRIDRMCQGLKIEGMLRQAEIEGIVDLYVQHLTVDEPKKEFRQQEVTKKSKLTLEEIDVIGGGLRKVLIVHIRGTFDDLGFLNTEGFNGISNACTYEFGQASYSGFAYCFFDMNEDTITNNDRQYKSANGDDIGEDIIKHDNESQMPNAKDDGIGQTVSNRSEVESQHDADVRNDNESQMPNVEDDETEKAFGNRSEVESAHEPDVREVAILGVDLVDEDYDMVSGDEDVAIVFNDIDKGNIGDSEDDDCCRFPDLNAKNDMKDPTFQIGMLFKNRDEFKEACRAYGIKHRFQIYFPRNEVRKLICLDGCWLKGTHGGQLLSAVAIDPNDCIFPLAYAVGLIGAVSELFPNAEHRFCVRNLYTNFRGRFKGTELKDLLWNIARSAYTARMDYWLGKMEEKNPEAREWLRDRPCENWSRALFRTEACCDILTNNPCECFNKYILDARDKPIISLLEMIRSKLMKRLFKKKEDIKKWNGGICPKIQKKLNEMKELSCLFEAHFSGGPNVQALGAGTQYVVA